jgi:hypothetical protein
MVASVGDTNPALIRMGGIGGIPSRCITMVAAAGYHPDSLQSTPYHYLYNQPIREIFDLKDRIFQEKLPIALLLGSRST